MRVRYRKDRILAPGYWILDTGLRKVILLIFSRIEHQISSIFRLWCKRLFYKRIHLGFRLVRVE